jgi:cysteinyl-tRNA synthetase
MSWKHLGETFDIHGGGIDLVFPHHENEIAQSRCAFHTKVMANYWMHNGHLQAEGEKMSKSLGNFVTIHELLTRRPEPWWGDVLRLNMLRTHYRQPIDWTEANLVESWHTLANLRRAVILANRSHAKPSEALLEALADDLNTPAAITELHRLAVEAMSTSGGTPADAAAELVGSMFLLGFDRSVAHVKEDNSLREGLIRAFEEDAARQKGLDPAWIDKQVLDRTAARKAKNFAEADRIRDELAAMGVLLKDTKDGTTWEIER